MGRWSQDGLRTGHYQKRWTLLMTPPLALLERAGSGGGGEW